MLLVNFKMRNMDCDKEWAGVKKEKGCPSFPNSPLLTHDTFNMICVVKPIGQLLRIVCKFID